MSCAQEHFAFLAMNKPHDISYMMRHRLVQELNQMVTATYAPTKQQLTPTKQQLTPTKQWLTPTKQQVGSDKSRGHSPPPADKVLIHTLIVSIYHFFTASTTGSQPSKQYC